MTTQHALLDAAIKKIGNRYLTTMLIAKRIRQLYHGAPALVEHEENESSFTIAVREIAEGHLTILPTTGTPPAMSVPLIHTSNGTADDSTPVTGTNEAS